MPFFKENKNCLCFPGKNIPWLAGNGNLAAETTAGSARFRLKQPLDNFKIGILSGTGITWLDNLIPDSYFLPGVAHYAARTGSMEISVTYAVPSVIDALVTLITVKNTGTSECSAEIIFEMDGGDIFVQSAGNTQPAKGSTKPVFFCGTPFTAAPSGPGNILSVRMPFYIGGPEEFRTYTAAGDASSVKKAVSQDPWSLPDSISKAYTQDGLIISTPDENLNRAVGFLIYNLRLGYSRLNGFVCDIFRWRDLWSRDFGSGLAPGGIAAGMYKEVRNTFKYEFNRYRGRKACGFKVSADASKGGSAEGIGFVLDAALKYFHATHDGVFLKSCYKTFKPWVDAWINRDYDEDGLITDTTDWMDHSRFQKLPEGAETLYSNVLFKVMAERFSEICAVLKKTAESAAYGNISAKARSALNKYFWNKRGYYDNYLLWGIPDESLDQAANSLAVIYGIADAQKTRQILDNIRNMNWKNHGSANIFPPMNYVPADNDQNCKCWPWWEAKEAKARFIAGDTEGGMKLLNRVLTPGRAILPGLIEEYVHPETGAVDPFAAHAFTTAAGSALEAIVEGLFGFKQEKDTLIINPKTPSVWKEWSCSLKLPEGNIRISANEDSLTVNSDNIRAKKMLVRVPDGRSPVKPVRCFKDDFRNTFAEAVPGPENNHSVKISFKNGKVKNALLLQKKSADYRWVEAKKHPKAALKTHKSLNCMIFYDSSLKNCASRKTVETINTLFSGLGMNTGIIDSMGLAGISKTGSGLLIIPGSRLPLRSMPGKSIIKAFDEYLDGGNKILFWGPECASNVKMGEHCGLIDWQVFDKNEWKFFNEVSGNISAKPERAGVNYWGEGPYFRGWGLKEGLFGLKGGFHGVYFENGPLAGMPSIDIDITGVFTGFSCMRPWVFSPLAYTKIAEERYPCLASIRNFDTGSEIILIIPEICNCALITDIIGKLNITED